MLKKLTQKALKMARKKATKKPTPAPRAKGVPKNFVQVPKRMENREGTLVKRVNKGLSMTKKQLVDLGKVARINAESITVNKKNYMSKAKLDRLKNLDEASHLRRAKRDLEGLGYFSSYFDKMDKIKKKPKSQLAKLKGKPKSAKRYEESTGLRDAVRAENRKRFLDLQKVKKR